jgi:hypothetical protein
MLTKAGRSIIFPPAQGHRVLGLMHGMQYLKWQKATLHILLE